jgi:iron(III) transport system substrate-binding protein
MSAHLARLRRLPQPLAIMLVALLVITAACGGGGTVTPTSAPTAAGTAAAAGKSLDVLIADAKKEGRLVLYSGDTEDVLKMEADLFKAKYGIQVDYVRALTDALVVRMSAEFDSGVNAADFYHASGEEIFEKKPQMWAPLNRNTMPDWEAYPEVARGPNYVYMRDAPSVVNYNTKLVTAAESPKTWQDMLDPKWKGKLLVSDPNASPTYMAWAQDMINTYGIQYLEKLRANEFKVAASGVPGAQQVAAGAALISFPARPVHSGPLRAQGAPIAFNVLGGANGAPIMGGVLAKAPHPNAALLFAHYMISREFMTEFCKVNEVMSFWNVDGKSPNLQVAGCMKAAADWKLTKLTLTDAQKATIMKALGL